MGVYQFQTFDCPGTVDEFEVNGRIVETYGKTPYNRRFVALVERPADYGEVRPATDFAEGVDPSNEPTCAGKGGECSRTVDEQGDTCWQHPAE